MNGITGRDALVLKKATAVDMFLLENASVLRSDYSLFRASTAVSLPS
jgi:hypothetical protein